MFLLKFVMFLAREFVVGNETVVIFIFGFKYLLHETSVVFVDLVCNKGAINFQFVNLSVKVGSNL